MHNTDNNIETTAKPNKNLFSGIATYRRPALFSEIKEHYHVVNGLTNMLKNDTIGTVYLFSGNAGGGKTSFAKILSRTIACKNRTPEGEPCNTCSSCTSVIQELSNSCIREENCANLGKEEVLNLIEDLRQPPLYGDRHIVILDEIQELHNAAKNALLKPLEKHINDQLSISKNSHSEDKNSTIYILATSQPEKLDEAILSRAIHYHLPPLSVQAITESLVETCRFMNVQFDINALESIARSSKGSLRKAYSTLEGVGPATNYNITLESIEPFNLSGYSSIANNLFKLAHNLDIPQLIQATQDASYKHTFSVNDFHSILNECESILSVPSNKHLFNLYTNVYKVFLEASSEVSKSSNNDPSKFFTSSLMQLVSLLIEFNQQYNAGQSNNNVQSSNNVQQHDINAQKLNNFYTLLAQQEGYTDFVNYIKNLEMSINQNNALSVPFSILNTWPALKNYMDYECVQKCLINADINGHIFE